MRAIEKKQQQRIVLWMEGRSQAGPVASRENERAFHLHIQDLRNPWGTASPIQNDAYSSIASWNEDGTYFTILDVERFEQDILPIYFRHRNFSSFVRQLNMYDFHKIRNEQNKNIFEHREFRRDAK